MDTIDIYQSRLAVLLTSTLLLIGFSAIACASGQTPPPTNVLQPTYTPQPTFTPQPTYTPNMPNNTKTEQGFPYSLPKNIEDMEGIKVNLVSKVGDIELSSSIHNCKPDGVTRFVSPGESAAIHGSASSCYNASGLVQWYKVKLQDGTLHWVGSHHLEEYDNILTETAELTSSIGIVEVITVIRDCEPYGTTSHTNAGEIVTILSTTPGCLNTSGTIKWFKIIMQDGSLYWIANKNLRLEEGIDSN